MRYINYTIFTRGASYLQKDIRSIVGDPGRGGKWVKGYLEHNNEMFIFVNIDGGGAIGHDYKNFWIEHDKVLDWKGDKQSSITDKYIRYILSGDYPIHLFTREVEYRPGTPYTYRGRVIPTRVKSKEPVNMILDLEIKTSLINLDDHIVEENNILDYKDLFEQIKRFVPKRSTNLRQLVLKENSYRCEIDPTHTTFISNSTKDQYMETHHIIPLSAQKYFENVKLDTRSNIACLCPNCHRLIHYGTKEDKYHVIEILYERHLMSLSQNNIILNDLEELMVYYNH